LPRRLVSLAIVDKVGFIDTARFHDLRRTNRLPADLLGVSVAIKATFLAEYGVAAWTCWASVRDAATADLTGG
jgi:hypothetical protein